MSTFGQKPRGELIQIGRGHLTAAFSDNTDATIHLYASISNKKTPS
jgi:hypothetical protein